MNKIRCLTIILLLLVTLLLNGCITTTDNGRQYGQITNVEIGNGMIFKESRLYFKSDISSSQEESLCIDKPELIEQARMFAESKERVVLLYHSELMTVPWRCHNSVNWDGGGIGILDGIERLKERNEQKTR